MRPPAQLKFERNLSCGNRQMVCCDNHLQPPECRERQSRPRGGNGYEFAFCRASISALETDRHLRVRRRPRGPAKESPAEASPPSRVPSALQRASSAKGHRCASTCRRPHGNAPAPSLASRARLQWLSRRRAGQSGQNVHAAWHDSRKSVPTCQAGSVGNLFSGQIRNNFRRLACANGDFRHAERNY